MNEFWITILISILPLWFLQNIIHELSHGLTAYIGWGWKFSIYPFPSYKLGYFTFASCKYKPKDGNFSIKPFNISMLTIMPKIVNLTFIIVSTLISDFTSSPILAGILLTFAIANFVDFVFGILTLFRSKPVETDLWTFQKASNINLMLLRTILVSISWCLFAVIVLSVVFYFR